MTAWRQILAFLVINTLHTIWYFVLHVVWRINGIGWKIDAIMEGRETKNQAQVLKVVWMNPLPDMSTPQTYFTVHEKFAPAEIVFGKRMHLWSVTSKTATFTEVDCDIMNVREHPFMWMSQTKRTTRLVVLPIHVFHDLVDNVNIDDRKVVWMFHTVRCGSTAWAQLFHSLPGWTALTEPQGISYSLLHGDHGYPSVESYSKSPEFKKFAVAVIKMHVRHAPPGQSVFWKGMIFDEHLIDTIKECFPEHRMLVAYRDALPSTTSFYRAFYPKGLMRFLTEVLLNHDPTDDKWWFTIANTLGFTNGVDHNFCKQIITSVRPKTCPEWFCFLWSAKVATVRRAIQRGASIKPIKYESLMGNRRETVTKVFKHLGLSSDLVDIACDSLDHDSQAGIETVSWDSRKQGNALEWTNNIKTVKGCNMILDAFNLPDLNNPMTLPDSI